MIKCEFDPARLAISMTGHANTAPKGQDIVCAAASILIETYLFTLQRNSKKHTWYSLEDGLSVRPVESAPPGYMYYAAGAYRTIRDGLQLLAQNYPDNIQITFNMPDDGG